MGGTSTTDGLLGSYSERIGRNKLQTVKPQFPAGSIFGRTRKHVEYGTLNPTESHNSESSWIGRTAWTDDTDYAAHQSKRDCPEAMKQFGEGVADRGLAASPHVQHLAPLDAEVGRRHDPLRTSGLRAA